MTKDATKIDKDTLAAIQAMSFEQALAELEGVVRKLESGEAPLEDSIASYERGIALKKHCEAALRDAQMKIEKISVDPDGSVKTDAFEEKTAEAKR